MEKLYVVDEASEILRVTNQTIQKWVREGRLKASWSGRQLVFTEDQLMGFVKPNEIGTEVQV